MACLMTGKKMKSRLPGLDIRTKLTLITWVVTFCFLFNDPLAHLLMLGFLVSYAACIRERAIFLKSLIPLAPIFLMIVLFAGFSPLSNFKKPENLELLFSTESGMGISLGGLKLGLTFICRLINMVFATRMLFVGEDIDQFMLLTHKLRMPFGIAYALGLAFRFIPELEKKRQMIITARKIRGADYGKSGLINNYVQQLKVLVPLMINAIIMAEKLTIGLLCRGFAYDKQRTELNLIKMRTRDYLLILVASISWILMIYFRTRYNWGVL